MPSGPEPRGSSPRALTSGPHVALRNTSTQYSGCSIPPARDTRELGIPSPQGPTLGSSDLATDQ